MKFLMTMYSIQDYGGIINHAEYLTKGLRNRGHEVDFCMLEPKQHHSNRRSYRADFSVYNELEGGTGYHFNQARGWLNVPKIPYLNELHRKRFKEKCSQYDAVLWHIPVPTLSKQNKGIKDWVDLYDHGSKNIAIIHDGNMPNLYPHLIKVSQHFHGAVCVHESAFHSAKNLDIPRKLIVNPFEIHGELGVEFEGRVGALAVQIFKAWKRVDTLVRAVPFINESVYVGGAGIEYRYMTSKEKCKPKYFDMDKVASQYEDFVNKPPTKRYPGYEIGQPDISLLASCNKNLEFFELDKMLCPNMGSPSKPEASEPPKTGLRTLTGKHYW